MARQRQPGVRWPKGRFRRGMALAGSIFLVGGVIWLWGLFGFVARIPVAVLGETGKTDAIVVLTGGTRRLEAGLTLLAGGKAGMLFVSGVYRGVDVTRLLEISRRNPPEFLCCVKLGHEAASTAGNARETAAWLVQRKYRSLRLVTANYHMPRSLLEFRHTMPHVKLVPNAVFPKNFKRQRWWTWPGSASLILSEYSKYLLAILRHLGEKPGAGTGAGTGTGREAS